LRVPLRVPRLGRAPALLQNEPPTTPPADRSPGLRRRPSARCLWWPFRPPFIEVARLQGCALRCECASHARCGLDSVLASSPNQSRPHIVFPVVGWSRGSLGERLLAPRGPGSDRRGGDDGEEYESACGEEGAVEAERQRLVDWVMGGDEVVGPARCD